METIPRMNEILVWFAGLKEFDDVTSVANCFMFVMRRPETLGRRQWTVA